LFLMLLGFTYGEYYWICYYYYSYYISEFHRGILPRFMLVACHEKITLTQFW